MTTPTLMTAAEMRAYLIERWRELEAQRAVIAAKQAAKETERLKVWAPAQLAVMLDTLKEGTREDSRRCNDHADALAIVDLARSLGYGACVNNADDEDSYYAVIKAPALAVPCTNDCATRDEGCDCAWMASRRTVAT